MFPQWKNCFDTSIRQPKIQANKDIPKLTEFTNKQHKNNFCNWLHDSKRLLLDFLRSHLQKTSNFCYTKAFLLVQNNPECEVSQRKKQTNKHRNERNFFNTQSTVKGNWHRHPTATEGMKQLFLRPLIPLILAAFPLPFLHSCATPGKLTQAAKAAKKKKKNQKKKRGVKGREAFSLWRKLRRWAQDLSE